MRLLGIDAPERKQAFGQKSKRSLSNLVFEKEVTIDYESQDQYKRYLGKITVDGKDGRGPRS